MQRILGTSERAKKERKVLWGLDAAAVPASSGAVGSVNSVVSSREGNAVLTEGQKALGEVVEALERKTGGDVSSSTGGGQANESNLPPALLALARTLNSTFGKIAETNNMLADVAAEVAPLSHCVLPSHIICSYIPLVVDPLLSPTLHIPH